jgi:hypothetical protein
MKAQRGSRDIEFLFFKPWSRGGLGGKRQVTEKLVVTIASKIGCDNCYKNSKRYNNLI